MGDHITIHTKEGDNDELRAKSMHESLIIIYGDQHSEFMLRSRAKSDKIISKEDDMLLERFYPTNFKWD